MKTERLNIRVDVVPGKYKWLWNLISIVLAVVIPVSIGIAVNSTAMQWVGFFFGVLSIFGWAAKVSKETTFSTYNEAIEYLTKQSCK